MSFSPSQAFLDFSFLHQLRPSCDKYQTNKQTKKSVYLHGLIKPLDGITARNVKNGERKHFIAFSAPLFLSNTLAI